MLVASKYITFVLILFIVTSCLNNARFGSLETRRDSSTTQASAPTTASSPSRRNPGTYTVKTGDTLYSIAFRFGLDYRKLAAANGVNQSYQIFQGQQLTLAEATPRSTTTSTQSVTSPPAQTQQNSRINTPSQEIGTVSPSVQSSVSTNISWVWPHNGKIVRTFNSSSSLGKGIDLSGQIGDSVFAAASGTVVYAGSGLAGYGNLIILEHPNSLLSAYAYNQEILVKEKDQVAAKQVIAKMGKQGDQPSLHFEIRQNGKPVNPALFLPSRN